MNKQSNATIINLDNIHDINVFLESEEEVRFYHDQILEVNLEFLPSSNMDYSEGRLQIRSGFIKLNPNKVKNQDEDDVFIYDLDDEDLDAPLREKIINRFSRLCDVCYIEVSHFEDRGGCHAWEAPFMYFEMSDDDSLYSGNNYLVCPSMKVDEEGNLILLFGTCSDFTPRAIVYDFDLGEELELTTIDEYRKYWNALSLDTLKHTAARHELEFDDSVSKEQLVLQLIACVEKFYDKSRLFDIYDEHDPVED